MAIPIAFIAGLLSFLSPCVLPLLPGYLSFLGGARWGIEIQRQTPRAEIITLTMAPSVLGFGAALWTMSGDQGDHAASGLGALAVLFLVFGAWDVTSREVPDWYPRLRIALTLAVVSLLGLSILGAMRG